jgi:long-chain acyl-CoA synthetase
VLPLFHIFGLNVVLGYTLYTGASVVLVQRFDPSTALETFAERGVTVVPGAPQVWSALAQMPDKECKVLSQLRVALTGAAKMPEQVTNQLKDRYGLVVHEGYGLTESSPVVTTSINGSHKVGSIGKPLQEVSIRLVDEHGDDAEEGDSGEIWVRGENVFAGYYNDQEATDRVLTADGWLRTGDIAVKDADGDLFLVDRMKDLIIVSGFNVYPAEVEQVLLAHSAIDQAAVVGVSHPHTGEAVRAYVVLHNGVHLDEESIIEHCQKQLARYKCPSKVLIVQSLPTGSTGRYCDARCVDFARVELLATRKPKNRIDTPTNSVIANARSSPNRPASVPLAESTNVPVAINTFPNAKRPAENTDRFAPVDSAGFFLRSTRQADHSAPKMMTSAGTPDPTAARIRGATPNTSLPVGN